MHGRHLGEFFAVCVQYGLRRVGRFHPPDCVLDQREPLLAPSLRMENLPSERVDLGVEGTPRPFHLWITAVQRIEESPRRAVARSRSLPRYSSAQGKNNRPDRTPQRTAYRVAAS